MEATGRRSSSSSVVIQVRELDENSKRDLNGVEEVERRCAVGPNGKVSLFTDLLGDPLCRVRHSPAYLMLVAEMVVVMDDGEGEGEGEEVGEKTATNKKKKSSNSEIVGMVRGCIKTVTCGQKLPRSTSTSVSISISEKDNNANNPIPLFTKVAYILGLRVSPSHRRMGIGLKLVRKLEEWFRDNGVEYSYLATEPDNGPSLALFVDRCGYSKFRSPSVLVQPVFAHQLRVSSSVEIIPLTRSDAESLYRARFSTVEFFPRDIDSVLRNKLSLGTFLAVPAAGFVWTGIDRFLAELPESWAVLSVWNCKDLWRLEVHGASRVTRGIAKTTRVLDRAMPWLRIPSVPEIFRPFGLHFLYGLGGAGPDAAKMVKALCGYAHNLAKERGCEVVATEVAGEDPIRCGIPHWKKLSCEGDLWCIKRLAEDYSDGAVGDWTKSAPGHSIFVDPREF